MVFLVRWGGNATQQPGGLDSIILQRLRELEVAVGVVWLLVCDPYVRCG